MCDLDNMWDEAAKIGTEEYDDDIMSILDNIPLESVEDDRDGTLFEDQWFMTSPHCFGPIPSNVLFFEPIPDRKIGIGPTHSSPIHNTPIIPLKIDAAPEEKPRGFQTQGHVSVPLTSATCNNPRKNPNPKSNSKDSTIPVRARSKRTKPSGPTKWHISSSIVPINQILEKDSTKRISTSSPSSTKMCAHCNVTKTPQWREGPNGPKTLCNACGVRYRTGRLFPEYRPACSPTFQPCLHSNSHKKVIEMRNDKAKLDSMNTLRI